MLILPHALHCVDVVAVLSFTSLDILAYCFGLNVPLPPLPPQPSTPQFLAQLFSKKTTRYCHSPGGGGGGLVGGSVMRKL